MMQTDTKINSAPNPIDVVITWVDGNDPVLAEKRNQYMALEQRSASNSGALATRFASNNEIRYCILSILKFAPFVRNIFIVTDGQTPDIFDEVKKYYPERVSSIRIIDHKEIFSGYEEFLPTFNSTTIESMIWRIEGLADNFVYFNDDVFLVRDIEPNEWFVNNRPVLRGKWLLPPFRKLFDYHARNWINRTILGNKGYQPKLSFYIRQWHAARLLGVKPRYFFHCHTPHPLSKSLLESYFTKNPDVLSGNISSRFRSHKQFIVISLANHLEILSSNANFAPLNLGYLHPYYSRRRLKKRIVQCSIDTTIKSVCAQSIDLLDQEVQSMIFDWMDRVLDLKTKDL
ncbi:MAG: stealth family protein [Tenuifilaceae bacterium]|jgi:hypothetical protein|nr:stealth family protein [Tenuifilaceae bacterium]